VEQVRTLHAPPGDWEVELTAGSMAAIDACFDNVLDPGCTVLVEQFTFTAALDALRSSRAHLATVRCDAEGLVPEALEARCAELRARNVRPRALFTIPKGQNPTGSVLRRERYEAVYAIACKYDFLIIEVGGAGVLTVRRTVRVRPEAGVTSLKSCCSRSFCGAVD
jgi:DNA-binding transcriptional MocR family regulator